MKQLHYIFLLLLVTTVTSCGIFGQQPDKKIEAVLKVKNAQEITEAIKVLQKRFRKQGALVEVSQKGANELNVILQTAAEANTVRRNLVSTAKLEFYEVISNQALVEDFYNAFEGKDSLAQIFNSKLVLTNYDGIPNIGYARPADTTTAKQLLVEHLPEKSSKLPENEQQWLWGIVDKDGMVPLYLVKTNQYGEPAMGGNIIDQAVQSKDQVGSAAISIKMYPEAEQQWETLTGSAFDNGFQIAMVINGLVYSAPGVTSGPIKGGMTEITGDFTIEEAQELAHNIELGYLPEMEIISFNVQPLD